MPIVKYPNIFSVVKSVQHGTVSLSTNDTTFDITISPVDVNYSVPIVYNGMGETYCFFYPTLYNSTTLRLQRANYTTPPYPFDWQVIEFYPGVVNQIIKGTATIVNADSLSITIPYVKIEKSVVILSGYTTTASAINYIPKLGLTNNTTLTATRKGYTTSVGTTFSYAVIEFK
jgi:hypothetical protein